jgi:tetratricopeptide (TPR) repeat protein
MFGGHIFAQQKTKITKADELPRRTVQLSGKALEILNDAPQLARLNDELIKNFQSDLEKYDIQDNSTLQAYYLTLMTLYAAKGDYDKALSYLPLARQLESKPAAKLTTGLFLETWIKTKRQIKDEQSEDFKRAFEKILRKVTRNCPTT